MNARLLGAALVTLSCLWGGWLRKRWYTRRRRSLSALCHALARMEGELSACDTDTWALLALLREGPAGGFFRTLSRRRGELEERTLAALWADTARQTRLPLREEECDIWNRAGQILGRYDGQTQAFLLRQVRRELETCLEAARGEEQRLGPVAVLLGLSTGLGLAVLLL